MTRALLYQPGPRWRIGVALGAAALIHFAAVSLASIHHREHVENPSTGDDQFPPIDVESDPQNPDSTPPPDLVAPLPTPDTPDHTFVDERSSPPPVRVQHNQRVAPIIKARTAGIPGPLSLSSAKALVLNAPRPEYPYEARRQKITGDGIVVMTVDPVSGSVTDVSMWKSTGSPVLDNAALTAFRRWRFKPGSVSSVKAPVTFTMSGPHY